MKDGPATWAWGIGFLALGVWGVVALAPGFWRGRHRDRLHHTFAPLGARMGRSIESLVPFVFVVVLYIGAMVVALLLAGPEEGDTNALSTVLGVVLLLVLAALFGILLFNRPRALVPPHLRDGHAGLVGSLFTRRKDRSST